MPDCDDLRILKRAAGTASMRCRALLEDCARLPTVTGLSPKQVLDSMLRASEARLTACAALVDHAERHGCGLAACRWPAHCASCSRSSIRITCSERLRRHAATPFSHAGQREEVVRSSGG